MRKRFTLTQYGRVRRCAIPERRQVTFGLNGQWGAVSYGALLLAEEPGTDAEEGFDRHANTIVGKFFDLNVNDPARASAGRLVLGECDLLELADQYDPS